MKENEKEADVEERLKNEVHDKMGVDIYNQNKNKKAKALTKILKRHMQEQIFNGDEGDGHVHNLHSALSISEVDQIMKPYKYYLKTINYNDLFKLLKYIILSHKKKFGFIMLIIHKNKNFGHFVCCYCDFNEFTCEYYDPFGDNPPNDLFYKFIHALIKFYKLARLVKLKINKIKHESFQSSYCGWYCIKFLVSRFHHNSFIKSTQYHLIKNNEKNIKKLKEHYDKFGYL